MVFARYYQCDQIKEDGMIGACSTRVGERKLIQVFGEKP